MNFLSNIRRLCSSFCVGLIMMISIIANISQAKNGDVMLFSAAGIIKIAGSSSLYVYLIDKSEKFSITDKTNTNFIIENIGSGNGIKLFCQKKPNSMLDIAVSSRPMHENESKACHDNGIDFQEVKFAHDAIVIIANKASPLRNIDSSDLYSALTMDHVNNWHDINPNLPDLTIKIYGPSSSSGSREVIVNKILMPFCSQKDRCKYLRRDGHYIDVGENYNILMQKLLQDQNSIGFIPLGFISFNRNDLKSITIDDMAPKKNTKYKLNRQIYLYINNASPKAQSFLEFLLQDLARNQQINYSSFGLLD